MITSSFCLVFIVVQNRGWGQQCCRGVGVAADKVKAVAEAGDPGLGWVVRSFRFALVNYSVGFIPELATISVETTARADKEESRVRMGTRSSGSI